MPATLPEDTGPGDDAAVVDGQSGAGGRSPESIDYQLRVSSLRVCVAFRNGEPLDPDAPLPSRGRDADVVQIYARVRGNCDIGDQLAGTHVARGVGLDLLRQHAFHLAIERQVGARATVEVRADHPDVERRVLGCLRRVGGGNGWIAGRTGLACEAERPARWSQWCVFTAAQYDPANEN